MSLALQVFVSSACHELRDLRATIKEWLEELGMTPVMSDEGGFPHADGMPPYATCLSALEECQLVIGVIDRYYGVKFDEWGPYPQFSGHGPTHAELKHALDKGKRVLLFVHNDTKNFYEMWRKNKSSLTADLPHGLQIETLELIEELKKRKPAPWIENFSDATELKKALNKEFINQLCLSLKETEKQTVDLASHLLAKVTESAPEVRKKIEAGLNPTLVLERDELRQKLEDIETKEKTSGVSKERLLELENEKAEVQSKYDQVAEQLGKTSLLLAHAAMKDASWIDFVRRSLAPKNPGRLPIHSSTDVALRGYHVGNKSQTPILSEVTWSLLPYTEDGLHRGYRAGIIFKGGNFSPGIVYTHRRRGEGLPQGQTDYFWHQPNIYFGNYLEVSTSDAVPESALSWRDSEWQVKNPEGHKSEWVPFTYTFDDVELEKIRTESFRIGLDLMKANKAAEAVEPLRKAYTFTDRMYGIDSPETIQYKEDWQKALDQAGLDQLRFRVGDRVRAIKGESTGKSGRVEELLLRVPSYSIKNDEGNLMYLRDEEVEAE